MGECAYFFKAQFPTAKIANKIAVQLNEFFSQASAAYWLWQDYKGENFMAELKKKFPLVAEYGEVNGFKKLDDFSRHLDLKNEEDNEVRIEGDTVGWVEEVGHMSDWTPLCKFVQKKYGAIKCVWDTEENGCGSLDSLQLYEYQAIVDSLLKHPELFPVLLRVHDDLDKMLDIKMRTSTKGTKREKKS
jgi:hypothetical protein